jgi:hypothetical protein
MKSFVSVIIRHEKCMLSNLLSSVPHQTLLYIWKMLKYSSYGPGVAQSLGSVIAQLFHDRGTRSRWMVISMSPPHFTPGKEPVPLLQEAGWALGPVWTGKNVVLTGIQSRTFQPVDSHYTNWANSTIYISPYLMNGTRFWKAL